MFLLGQSVCACEFRVEKVIPTKIECVGPKQSETFKFFLCARINIDYGVNCRFDLNILHARYRLSIIIRSRKLQLECIN